MGRRKKEGTLVVSIRMPTYLYEFFRKQAAKKDSTINSVIVSFLESCACAKEKKELLQSYKEWLEEEYKKKLARKLEKKGLTNEEDEDDL
ncbi:hypothetical protein [Hippea alviniae]|uniref:hypothetical protein n=1 Tax=Hippea alviniae TaxID=1279027 RepID=UPI0003B3D15A|nr:hypothetical protein [Hippea alviniae]